MYITWIFSIDEIIFMSALYTRDKIVIVWLVWDVLTMEHIANQNRVDLPGFVIDFPSEQRFKFRTHGMNSLFSFCRLLHSGQTCQSLEGEIHLWSWTSSCCPCIICKNTYFFISIQTCCTSFFLLLSLCLHWSTKQLFQSLFFSNLSRTCLETGWAFAGTSERPTSRGGGYVSHVFGKRWHWYKNSYRATTSNISDNFRS